MPELGETIKALIQERASIWEQAKTLLDTAETEKRDLSAEEEQTWTKHNEELSLRDAKIAEYEALDVRNKAADEARARFEAAVRPHEEPVRTENSLDTRIRSWLNPDTAEYQPKALNFDLTAQDKAEARSAWESRTLSKLTAAAGSNTVPTDFVRRLYQHLIENSAIRQTNATVLTTQGGEAIQIPKTTAHGGGALVAEAGTIAASDPTFGQVTLDAYKYGVLIQVSSELVTDTAVDLLGYLALQSGRAIGNAAGTHFITGTGTGQPNGVMTAATVGVTSATATAGVPTADNLIDLMYSVSAPYRQNAYWLLRDATVATIRKLKDTTNQYIWQPGITTGAPNMLLGYPVVTDPNVAATGVNNRSIAFGDFSAYYIRDVQGVRFERSDDFAFNQDLVSFRALLRTDGDLLDTAAIKVFVGAAT